MMERYQVILAYEGTQFEGFQRQEHKHRQVRTVQNILEDTLRQLGWHDKAIMFAGRTDVGVHASGQVIGFDLEWAHTTEELRNALNARLPVDISVIQVHQSSSEFHPRFDAIARQYRYRIYFKDVRDPLRERYFWRLWPPIAPEPLIDVSQYLVGELDFGAFGRSFSPKGTTVRKVYQANWFISGDELSFEITANAFLYHMIRRLVNAQIMVATGKIDKLVIRRSLYDKQNNLIHGMAPARGLELVKVIYK